MHAIGLNKVMQSKQDKTTLQTHLKVMVFYVLQECQTSRLQHKSRPFICLSNAKRAENGLQHINKKRR